MENPRPLPTVRRGFACTMDAWCVLCLTNIKGKTNFPGHKGYRNRPPVRVPFVEGPMKKPTPAEKKRASIEGIADDGFAKAHPKIVEYLITVEWEDGSAREPSALSVTIRDGMVNVALNDKALKQSMYSTAGTLKEALKLLEGALKDELGAWRPWKAGKGR